MNHEPLAEVRVSIVREGDRLVVRYHDRKGGYRGWAFEHEGEAWNYFNGLDRKLEMADQHRCLKMASEAGLL